MNSFSKAKRLRHKREFDLVFKTSQKIVTPHFVFLYKQNDRSCSRLGLVISKRKIVKAHDRNKIKRLIRETFRCKPSLPTIDIVVLARQAVAGLDHRVLLTQLNQAWNRLA